MEHEPSERAELDEIAHKLAHVGGAIMRMHGHGHPKVEQSLRGLNLVLKVLATEGDQMSPGDLAQKCGLTDARIANILRVLEERGLVCRSQQVHDKRRVMVSLTEEGRAEVEGSIERMRAFTVGFLEELGLDDARELLRILTRTVEIMRRRRDEGRAATPVDVEAGEGRA
ncbi:MarR family winged helix-turn-helix transcriptional regulator [Collinsella vaginalis]|uniref:MarR family winged helix-turn-helix transcriptional regulator n=1 Tax=Collinsella vaginalis TaxID=1870987 RepID=UPI000A26A60F|nr:MarR family transcriptional regulator [Collinsella vaginalis]